MLLEAEKNGGTGVNPMVNIKRRNMSMNETEGKKN